MSGSLTFSVEVVAKYSRSGAHLAQKDRSLVFDGFSGSDHLISNGNCLRDGEIEFNHILVCQREIAVLCTCAYCWLSG